MRSNNIWKRLFTALLCAACAGSASADLTAMRAKGTLRVLVCDGVQPVFFALEGGPAPGFDREVLDGFAQLLRLRLEVVRVPTWGDLVPALLAGKGDVIAGGFSDTLERRKQIAFSAEVFPTRIVVVSRAPHRVVRTLEELRAEKVGTTKGSSMLEELLAAGYPAANVVFFPPTRESLDEGLSAGRITAALEGLEDAMLAARKETSLQLGMFLGPPGSQAFGVRQDDPELRRALDDHVSGLRRSPKWSRLVVKYFGDAALQILRKMREN